MLWNQTEDFIQNILTISKQFIEAFIIKYGIVFIWQASLLSWIGNICKIIRAT